MANIIFKPRRCDESDINSTSTVGTTTPKEGELFAIRRTTLSGTVDSFELYLAHSNTTNINSYFNNHIAVLCANNMRMTAIRPTSATETGLFSNLSNAVNSKELGKRIADMTNAICQRRLFWTDSATSKDGTINVDCIYNSVGEYYHAIMTIVEVDVSITSNSGPIIPVTIADPLNYITINGITYRAGYYQGSTNGGGAYIKITKPDPTNYPNRIAITLDQAYINGTGKSGLTGQFRVKTLYEKYCSNFWN